CPGEAGKIIAGFKTQTQAHGRSIRIGVAAGVVSGRVDESPLGRLHRETHGVFDLTGCHGFVIANEPWKNRQTRSVRRGPVIRAEVVGPEIEERSGATMPAWSNKVRVIGFIKQATVF